MRQSHTVFYFNLLRFPLHRVLLRILLLYIKFVWNS